LYHDRPFGGLPALGKPGIPPILLPPQIDQRGAEEVGRARLSIWKAFAAIQLRSEHKEKFAQIQTQHLTWHHCHQRIFCRFALRRLHDLRCLGRGGAVAPFSYWADCVSGSHRASSAPAERRASVHQPISWRPTSTTSPQLHFRQTSTEQGIVCAARQLMGHRIPNASASQSGAPKHSSTIDFLCSAARRMRADTIQLQRLFPPRTESANCTFAQHPRRSVAIPQQQCPETATVAIRISWLCPRSPFAMASRPMVKRDHNALIPKGDQQCETCTNAVRAYSPS